MNSKKSSCKPFTTEVSILLLTLLLFPSSAFGAPAKKPLNKKPPALVAPVNKNAPASEKAPQAKSDKSAEKKDPIKNEVTSCKQEITLEKLIANPEEWVGKEVCFNGVFSSFSALALDYPPAMRERKKYISITLFRPNTKVPLGELKLAMKIDEAQRHELLPKVSEGDSVKVKGKVFSAALGEPWADIEQIQITRSPSNKEENSTNAFDEL